MAASPQPPVLSTRLILDYFRTFLPIHPPICQPLFPYSLLYTAARQNILTSQSNHVTSLPWLHLNLRAMNDLALACLSNFISCLFSCCFLCPGSLSLLAFYQAHPALGLSCDFVNVIFLPVTFFTLYFSCWLLPFFTSKRISPSTVYLTSILLISFIPFSQSELILFVCFCII